MIPAETAWAPVQRLPQAARRRYPALFQKNCSVRIPLPQSVPRRFPPLPPYAAAASSHAMRSGKRQNPESFRPQGGFPRQGSRKRYIAALELPSDGAGLMPQFPASTVVIPCFRSKCPKSGVCERCKITVSVHIHKSRRHRKAFRMDKRAFRTGEPICSDEAALLLFYHHLSRYPRRTGLRPFRHISYRR